MKRKICKSRLSVIVIFVLTNMIMLNTSVVYAEEDYIKLFFRANDTVKFTMENESGQKMIAEGTNVVLNEIEGLIYDSYYPPGSNHSIITIIRLSKGDYKFQITGYKPHNIKVSYKNQSIRINDLKQDDIITLGFNSKTDKINVVKEASKEEKIIVTAMGADVYNFKNSLGKHHIRHNKNVIEDEIKNTSSYFETTDGDLTTTDFKFILPTDTYELLMTTSSYVDLSISYKNRAFEISQLKNSDKIIIYYDKILDSIRLVKIITNDKNSEIEIKTKVDNTSFDFKVTPVDYVLSVECLSKSINVDGAKSYSLVKPIFDSEPNDIIDTNGLPFELKSTSKNNVFKDVETDTPFNDAIYYMYHNDYMLGISQDEFAPDLPITRGMFMVIFSRIQKEEKIGHIRFQDVNEDDYYYDAICMGVKSGIINGYSDTLFAPNDNLTREQLISILYRYANYKKYDISNLAELYNYKDLDKVSDYAITPIKWAVANDIMIKTDENILSAKKKATRAETAIILMNFIEKFVNTRQ